MNFIPLSMKKIKIIWIIQHFFNIYLFSTYYIPEVGLSMGIQQSKNQKILFSHRACISYYAL